MEEIEPTGDLKWLLQRFHDYGGEVNYVLIETKFEIDEKKIHSLVARFGMIVIRERADAARCAGRSGNTSRDFYPFGDIDLSVRRSATRQTLSNFMIDYYSAFGGRMISYDERPRPAALTRNEIDTLFRQINTLIFGELARWSIRRWSTDWSTYFESERDPHLWTLVHENQKHCVWIGASATD